ncbi:MAG: PQQ-binding-like beta-propeller repeat protein [Actinomycetota bacterium]|nr:PQQ-binding-like beta-propeller repeat protein [Actinomycetota bacterium]
MRRATALLAAALLVAGIPPLVAQAKAKPCTKAMAGGDWPMYGGDFAGTQRQDSERTLSRSTVGTLELVWKTGDTGYAQAPPIVSGGCVFINTGGHVVAFDLATGRTVWTSQGADTSGTFAVTVANGRVHVGLNNGGHPKAAAFDVSTGRLLWQSGEIWFGHDTTQQSSGVVFDGIQVLFTTGPDNDPEAMQGYGLIDAATGRTLYKSTTIPRAQIAKGYHGGGVWGTPTIDTRTKYLYVGTSNPESKTKEHAYDDAIIKLDLDRRRPTFGKIVASYKGTPDSVTGYDNPVCQTVGGTLWYNAGTYGASPTCGQIDVDFGNGPTLWRNPRGRLMGAATQKSGYLHVFYADTMKPAYDIQLFPTLSFLGGMIGRIATDGRTLYVPANPGVVYALDAMTGAERWRTVLPGVPMTGGNVALANGVAYYVTEPGAVALDTSNGSQLWSAPFSPGAKIYSAVAIAGHRLVVNDYGSIQVFRLP